MSVSMLMLLGFVVAIVLAYFYAPKGWRTRAVNGVVMIPNIIGMLLEYFSGFPWTDLFSVNTALMMTLFVNVAGIVLRQVTTTPPGVSEDNMDDWG